MKNQRNRNPLKKWLFLCLLMAFACAALSAVTVKMTKKQVKESRAEIVSLAKAYVGTPYKTAGSDPRPKKDGGDGGFDCSGFVGFVVKNISIPVTADGKASQVRLKLPRRAEDMYLSKWMHKISKEELSEGDFVFFMTTGNGHISHVGIYIGGENRQFISALSDGPNAGVVVSSLNQDYWKERYYGSARILPAVSD